MRLSIVAMLTFKRNYAEKNVSAVTNKKNHVLGLQIIFCSVSFFGGFRHKLLAQNHSTHAPLLHHKTRPPVGNNLVAQLPSKGM